MLIVRVQADEGSVKDAYELLQRISAQMSDPREASDPGGAVSARAEEYKTSARPGWGEFKIMVCIPQYEPPEEKAAAEGDEG